MRRMMKRFSSFTKTGIAFAVLFASTTATIAAFDWPQAETASDSFYSYFGQLRGGTLESSLIFKDSSDVKAADSGKVIAVITEHGSDFGWFESTIGNAVIVAHKDSIVTVYGNLDGETIPSSLYTSKDIPVGTPLGASGNSGWQEGQSCLEFQVLDTKNRSVINPRILMPRIGDELPLVIGELTLDDRNGKTSYLALERTFKAGTYSLYRDRQRIAVPYRTTVAINGAAVETISYDMLKANDGKLCAFGNTYYPRTVLYPDDSRQLLGQIRLTSGRNSVSITVTDILGERKTVSFSLEVF